MHRTDWFYAARWGVASHYLADSASNTAPVTLSADAWNRQVDAFDVEGLADQLAAAKVGYFMLTVGQNSGFYLAPNATYDRFVGIQPSKCAQRDLITDMATALKQRGIPLLVYLPSGAPAADAQACTRLQWAWGFKGGWPHSWEQRTGQRLAVFQLMWEEIIREWSLHWGKLVRGWWFDGCYFADEMYRHPDTPNFHSLAAAARAGNPDSLIAFNPGILLDPHSDAEDFTAGETNDPEQLVCTNRWVESPDGHREQYHAWSYLGQTWGQLPLRFTNEQACRFTRQVTDQGGVMTWDVPIRKNGHLPSIVTDQLNAIGATTKMTNGERHSIVQRRALRN